MTWCAAPNWLLKLLKLRLIPSVSVSCVPMCLFQIFESVFKNKVLVCGRAALYNLILLFVEHFPHLSFSGNGVKGIAFSWVTLVTSSSV